MLPGTSPNDPLFFMHHCFCDRLWADWQRVQAERNPDLTTQYYPHEDGPVGHRLNDAMYPWIDECVTPMSMLDYRALGFQYDNEPEMSVPFAAPELAAAVEPAADATASGEATAYLI